MARITTTISTAIAGGRTVSVSSGVITVEATGHPQPHRQPVHPTGGGIAAGQIHRNQLAASG
jgi:hypothetical protein